MTKHHYPPPGRLAPAMPGFYISDATPGAVIVVYPYGMLADYVAAPPKDASLDMVVAIHASKIAVEEVDEFLAKLADIPK